MSPRAQVGEGAQRAAAAPAGGRSAGARGAAAEQAVLGDHGESEARRDEAVAQARLGEREVRAGWVPLPFTQRTFRRPRL